MRPAAFLLAVLGASGAVLAQVSPSEIVVAAKDDPARNLFGGLVAVDPGTSTVNAIRWSLGVIIEFEDVLVESGTGNLFVAGAATGPLARRLEHWTLAGYALATTLPLAQFTTDIVAMTQEPFGDLWVLTTDPSQLATNGELWRVDPRGAALPRLVESWGSADGTPVAICSDANRIFVASHRLRGPAVTPAFWEVSPLGGKRELPVLATAITSQVLDLDLHRCGNALLVAMNSGMNSVLNLTTRTWRNHSTLPAGRNRAVQFPSPVIVACAGDGGPASVTDTFTWIERGVPRVISLPNLGLVTGLHGDPAGPAYHGSYRGPIPANYSCAGTGGGTPQLSEQNGPPDLGKSSYGLAVDLAFTPTTVSLLIGIQATQIDLQPIGFPAGCALLVIPDLVLSATTNTSPAMFSLSIPCDPTLHGAVIHAQFFAGDPGAGGLGWTSSARATITLG